MNNACIFLEKEIPVRECLIRKIAAKKRAERGVEGFDPCLHCDKVRTKEETEVANKTICIDCKEDMTIISHGRCYRCLKKARAAGVVPPVGESPKGQAAAKAYREAKKPVESAIILPGQLPGKPEPIKPPTITPGDLVDLATVLAHAQVMSEELMQGAARIISLGNMLRTTLERLSDAQSIIRKHLPGK